MQQQSRNVRYTGHATTIKECTMHDAGSIIRGIANKLQAHTSSRFLAVQNTAQSTTTNNTAPSATRAPQWMVEAIEREKALVAQLEMQSADIAEIFYSELLKLASREVSTLRCYSLFLGYIWEIKKDPDKTMLVSFARKSLEEVIEQHAKTVVQPLELAQAKTQENSNFQAASVARKRCSTLQKLRKQIQEVVRKHRRIRPKQDMHKCIAKHTTNWSGKINFWLYPMLETLVYDWEHIKHAVTKNANEKCLHARRHKIENARRILINVCLSLQAGLHIKGGVVSVAKKACLSQQTTGEHFVYLVNLGLLASKKCPDRTNGNHLRTVFVVTPKLLALLNFNKDRWLKIVDQRKNETHISDIAALVQNGASLQEIASFTLDHIATNQQEVAAEKATIQKAKTIAKHENIAVSVAQNNLRRQIYSFMERGMALVDATIKVLRRHPAMNMPPCTQSFN